MPERSALMMDTLLGVHRARDPKALLDFLLRQMEPEYGSAIACSYLLDPAAGHFRCDLVAGAAADATRALAHAEVRIPMVVPSAAALPPVGRLAETGIPVHVTEQVPAVLEQLWGREPAETVRRVLQVKFAAVAPVCTPQEPLGVLILLVIDNWPVDAAAECTAHAAVALANLCERRGPAQGNDPDREAGLSSRDRLQQAVDRELCRADRFRRTVSLVVVEVPEAERTPARMQGAAALVGRIVRQADAIGLLEPGRIAVMLAEAPSGGAAVFIRRMQQEAGPDLASLRFAIAMFPQDGRTCAALVEAATSRLAGSDSRPPATVARAGLRAAFPNFRMAGEASSRYGT